MKKLTSIVALPVASVALLLGANTTVAQVAEGGPDNPDGFYLGGGLGNYTREIDDVDDADFDFDEEESAARLFAGWRFNQFFGVQLDHYDFDEASASVGVLDISTETEGWAPSLVGTLPLGPVDLYGRAGMIFWDVRIDADNSPFFDDSGNDPVYAAGLGLTFFERLAVNFEYEVIDIEAFDESEAVWAMVGWRF